MLTYGRLLVRVAAPHSQLAKELNTIRQSGIVKTFCSVSHASASAAEQPSSSTAKALPQKVDSSCCGFAKDLINGPSTVLEHGIFGEDACFVTAFKHTHVAGE